MKSNKFKSGEHYVKKTMENMKLRQALKEVELDLRSKGWLNPKGIVLFEEEVKKQALKDRDKEEIEFLEKVVSLKREALKLFNLTQDNVQMINADIEVLSERLKHLQEKTG